MMDVDDTSSKVGEKNIPEGHPIGTTIEAYWRNASWRRAIIIERGMLCVFFDFVSLGRSTS